MTHPSQLRDVSHLTEAQIADFFSKTRRLIAVGNHEEARKMWETLPLATKRPAILGG